MRPFGNLGIGISASALALWSASVLQKKFFRAKFLFLPFEVSYKENIYGEVLFKYPCTPF